MNKAGLVSHVAAHAAVNRATAGHAVSAVFSAIADALARDEAVTIPGFGRFATRTRATCGGTNPATGAEDAHEGQTVFVESRFNRYPTTHQNSAP